MPTVDPTYPLYPIINLVTATLLLAMLISNATRHSWNLGVTLLVLSLFLELSTSGANAIVWSDNADIKGYVYCDIVSHLQVFVSIVKPACTLIITRYLYQIASLRSVEPPSRREKNLDATFNWTIGIGLPTLVTGIFYYLGQVARFEVVQGFGCTNAVIAAGIELILMFSWPIILPLISTLFYCPRILYVFYRHDHETHEFLQSSASVSRNSYMRILAVGCLDILLTLPLGVIQMVLLARESTVSPFYPGWSFVHSEWEPFALTYNELVESGTLSIARFYYERWASPALSISVLLLFGFTLEARAAYWRSIVAARKLLGRTIPQCNHHEPRELSQIQFGRWQRAVGSSDSQPSVEDDGSLAADKVCDAGITASGVSMDYEYELGLSSASPSAFTSARVLV